MKEHRRDADATESGGACGSGSLQQIAHVFRDLAPFFGAGGGPGSADEDVEGVAAENLAELGILGE